MHASPITSAAWCPWWTPSGPASPEMSAFLCTRLATAATPATPAKMAAASAGHRRGARSRKATTPTPAAAKAPREEARYMSAARIGSGIAASARTSRERLEHIAASSRGTASATSIPRPFQYPTGKLRREESAASSCALAEANVLENRRLTSAMPAIALRPTAMPPARNDAGTTRARKRASTRTAT